MMAHAQRIGHARRHRNDGDAVIHQAGLYGLAMRLWGRQGRRWRADIARRLNLQPGQRVLDVASGTGHLAIELAAHVSPGGEVNGVDASPEMVHHASANGARRGVPVTFQYARAQELPFADDTLDVVTSTLAFHHVAAQERPQAVREMRRVLRPGGTILIADAQVPSAGLARWISRLVVGHAQAEKPLDQAAELLAAAGFINLGRGDTSASWIGVVTATK